jgi:hypothetical protein
MGKECQKLLPLSDKVVAYACVKSTIEKRIERKYDDETR